ncbi:efflux transporter outer membrane subunit [Sphingobium sp. DC-2]|uniref:efflux transporter outer membrane subunit n=1 Tax=Sphingobium sp. DC-2 TaxID=1303256 RepID=UPI0009DCFED6|nr:efflux transporter outer membrane subunit [Sphingobium sp. DC-2]
MAADRRFASAAGGPRCCLVLAGVGALSLTACSFAPRYERPEMPVPAQFVPEVSDAATIAALGWREFFREPELQKLIDEALVHNRDVHIAAARVAEARASWRIEGAALYPQLDAVGTGTRGRSIFNLPGVGTQTIDLRQWSAQLNAGWEVDFWGRLRNLRDAAREQYLASEEARRAVATDLVAQVANGYLLEREYEERAALARRTIETRREALRIARRRFEVGSGSKLDMSQAQLLLGQSETALHTIEQDRGVNRNALALLVGRPVEIGPGTLRLAEQGPAMTLPPGLPSNLLIHRPDIVAAEYRLRAANANIGAARAAFLPNINLSGAYGTASDALDKLFADGTEAWTFTPTITLPLFNAGRLAANLDVAEARRDIAVAEYEQTIQRAFRDVSDALVRRRQIGLQIESTRSMLEALAERARLAELRVQNGRAASIEVLDAQRDLFDTEQALIQLRRAELASVVALYSALGGGFPASTIYREDPAR